MYPRLQRTYCRVCKVHVSSVKCTCTHSYSPSLSRHANEQNCEHKDMFVLSEPAYFSREPPPPCRMEQFYPQKELETALDGVATLMTVLSLFYSLFLSLSFSFYFFLTRTFMTAPSNKTNTPTVVQHGPVAVLISIRSSCRYSEKYGQPHTHTHVTHDHHEKQARGCKGERASRTP